MTTTATLTAHGDELWLDDTAEGDTIAMAWTEPVGADLLYADDRDANDRHGAGWAAFLDGDPVTGVLADPEAAWAAAEAALVAWAAAHNVAIVAAPAAA